MVETRIKPYSQQAAERDRRELQRRATLRKNAGAMVLLAAIILTWWLLHTNPHWIFPAGWWRP